jgi:Fe-Mn family superoxide dismutase
MLSSAACQWARPLLRRSMGMAAVGTVARAKHTLPQLPYDFGALEPGMLIRTFEIKRRNQEQCFCRRTNFNLNTFFIDSAAISGEIMQIHYTKHHQTYVNNLNAALEKLEEATAKNDVNAQIGTFSNARRDPKPCRLL